MGLQDYGQLDDGTFQKAEMLPGEASNAGFTGQGNHKVKAVEELRPKGEKQKAESRNGTAGPRTKGLLDNGMSVALSEASIMFV